MVIPNPAELIMQVSHGSDMFSETELECAPAAHRSWLRVLPVATLLFLLAVSFPFPGAIAVCLGKAILERLQGRSPHSKPPRKVLWGSQEHH